MFCIHCGSGDQAGGACTICGQPIPRSIEEAAAPAAPIPAPGNKQYHGVGGWLLLFCISCTLLSPAMIVFTMAQSWNTVNRAMEANPGFRIYGLAVYGSNILLIVSSVFAGLALWTKNRDALRAVAFFFCALALTAVTAYGLPYALRLGSRVTDALWKEDTGLRELPRMGIYLLIWVSYFKKSKRVLATYGRNL